VLLRFAVMTVGPAGTPGWAEHGAASATGPSAAARTWRAPTFSVQDAQYLIGDVVGLVLLPIGVDHALSPTTDFPRGPGVTFAALGALCIAVCGLRAGGSRLGACS
jgi:hypothetical protein